MLGALHTLGRRLWGQMPEILWKSVLVHGDFLHSLPILLAPTPLGGACGNFLRILKTPQGFPCLGEQRAHNCQLPSPDLGQLGSNGGLCPDRGPSPERKYLQAALGTPCSGQAGGHSH